MLLIYNYLRYNCHPERTGPQTLFSSGAPKERSVLFGVEFGGGESKDLRLLLEFPDATDANLIRAYRLPNSIQQA